MSAAQYPRTGVNVSAGSTLANHGSVSIANTGGFHFGLSSNTLTASAGVSAAIQSISAGSTRITSGQVVFSSNGLSFGLSSNTLTGQMFPIGYTNNGRGGVFNGLGVFRGSVLIQRVQFANPMTATIGAIMGFDDAGDANTGNKLFTVPLTWSITPGQYLIGIAQTDSSASIALYTMTGSTASLQASGSCAFSFATPVGVADFQGWAPNIQAIRAPGGAGDYTNYWADGTAPFSAPPASLHLSDVNQTTTRSGYLIPYFELAGDV